VMRSPRNPGICMAVGAVIAPPLVDGLIATSGGHGGEVSDLDFEVRNLDFTEVGRCGTLRS
jgi:hypothetical protein